MPDDSLTAERRFQCCMCEVHALGMNPGEPLTLEHGERLALKAWTEHKVRLSVREALRLIRWAKGDSR